MDRKISDEEMKDMEDNAARAGYRWNEKINSAHEELDPMVRFLQCLNRDAYTDDESYNIGDAMDMVNRGDGPPFDPTTHFIYEVSIPGEWDRWWDLTYQRGSLPAFVVAAACVFRTLPKARFFYGNDGGDCEEWTVTTVMLRLHQWMMNG